LLNLLLIGDTDKESSTERTERASRNSRGTQSAIHCIIRYSWRAVYSESGTLTVSQWTYRSERRSSLRSLTTVYTSSSSSLSLSRGRRRRHRQSFPCRLQLSGVYSRIYLGDVNCVSKIMGEKDEKCGDWGQIFTYTKLCLGNKKTKMFFVISPAKLKWCISSFTR